MDNITDFDITMNPFDAGLGALVDLDKPDFIGKDALVKISQSQKGKKYLVLLVMIALNIKLNFLIKVKKR